ncbi:MAG: hypothetical protein ACLP36_14970, partial [Acidimicrobiales bacterium]
MTVVLVVRLLFDEVLSVEVLDAQLEADSVALSDRSGFDCEKFLDLIRGLEPLAQQDAVNDGVGVASFPESAGGHCPEVQVGLEELS